MSGEQGTVIEARVLGPDGNAVGSAALMRSVFDDEVNEALVHQVLVAQLAGRRRGTASAKSKGEVEGGSRKPWRQKKTGRARAGSTRSPLWRGGGVVFPPTPRSYAQKTPKKMRRKALRSALSARFREGRLLVLEDLDFDAPKTKRVVELLKTLGLDGTRTLFVLGERNDNFWLSARNIPGVRVVREWQSEETEENKRAYSTQGVTLYHVLEADWIVVFRSALQALQTRLI